MIFYNIEKISKDRNIENKYMLSMLVSTRARQLSEKKGRAANGSEKFITSALNEVASGKINFNFVDVNAV